LKKLILGLAATAAIAAPLAMAAPAEAAVTASGSDSSMADAIPGFTDNYAQSHAEYSTSVTTNNQWVITTNTLKTFYEPYNSSWVATFTFTTKVPVAPVQNHVASTSGTVTHTTGYGTTTEAYSVPNGTTTPWSIVGTNVVIDPSSAAARAIRDTQEAIVYQHAGQNAAYWFPAN
jgi:hypothetical protein